MDQAALSDREAVQDGRPAIEKLKLLPEVVAVLQKSVRGPVTVSQILTVLSRPHLEATILEADILTQMKNWLEPIGKAMPALNIQRALLEALGKVSEVKQMQAHHANTTLRRIQLDIETSQLKASELGKVVLFYTKNPKLDSQIRRLADQLVSKYSCLPADKATN